MKTDKHNMDLEQLLGTLEHAGRDKRRQEEIGAMIDRMAGMESGKRKEERGKSRPVWRWTVRVAAAACVFFFIVTAVRVWFIPTGSTSTQVAEVEMPEVVLPVEPATAEESIPMAVVPHRVRVKPVAMQPVVEESSEPIVIEDYFVEENVEESLPVEEQVEELVNNQIEMIAQPVVSIAQTDEPVLDEPVSSKSAKSIRHNLLSSLIRRAEPSKMDGTMLAINIL